MENKHPENNRTETEQVELIARILINKIGANKKTLNKALSVATKAVQEFKK